jgi:hypothetical protein
MSLWRGLAVDRPDIALIASVGKIGSLVAARNDLFDFDPRRLLDYGKKARLPTQFFLGSTRERDPGEFYHQEPEISPSPPVPRCHCACNSRNRCGCVRPWQP